MSIRYLHRVRISSVRNFVASKCESRINPGLANRPTWSVLSTSRGCSLKHFQTARRAISCLPPHSRAFNAASVDKSSNDTNKTSQRPLSQTIDEAEVSKFSRLSALWWDECGEFQALHSLNELRIPLIRDTLISLKRLDQYDVANPLDGFWIMDVGSGGGILSEPLARLGASVVGLEASEESIKVAQTHLISDSAIRDKISYIHGTVEEVAESQAGKFDAVVVSEVLEHVSDAHLFVNCACKLVRPGGSIFFTTINKTRLAYLLGIVVAERLLHLVPAGTHDWEKFVPPEVLQDTLEKSYRARGRPRKRWIDNIKDIFNKHGYNAANVTHLALE
ncbi:hypothetical protein BsWGS_28302 [Bradybaena similaris]